MSRLNEWLESSYSSTHKGRSMIAKALGVALEEIMPDVTNYFERNWASAVKSKFERDMAGAHFEIDWQRRRNEFFCRNLIKLLNKSEKETAELVLKDTEIDLFPYFDPKCTCSLPHGAATKIARKYNLSFEQIWLYADN